MSDRDKYRTFIDLKSVETGCETRIPILQCTGLGSVGILGSFGVGKTHLKRLLTWDAPTEESQRGILSASHTEGIEADVHQQIVYLDSAGTWSPVAGMRCWCMEGDVCVCVCVCVCGVMCACVVCVCV